MYYIYYNKIINNMLLCVPFIASDIHNHCLSGNGTAVTESFERSEIIF